MHYYYTLLKYKVYTGCQKKKQFVYNLKIVLLYFDFISLNTLIYRIIYLKDRGGSKCILQILNIITIKKKYIELLGINNQ